jgi:hypothetical protein
VEDLPLPMPPISTLRTWVANCDPMKPVTEFSGPADESFYVEFDVGVELRGEDGSCAAQMARQIQLAEPGASTMQLFTGFPGAGKTTELHRLKHMLEKEPGEWSHVVMIDALAYFDRHTPLTITDMLRVLAWHLDREATTLEKQDPDKKPGYALRLWAWLQSDVELKEVGFEAYGASLMAEIKDNPSFRAKAEAALQLRFQHFAKEAHQEIQVALLRIRAATGLPRVVVIFDGLEKITALKVEDRPRVEESIEAVFSSHIEWLKLPCHVIYTFPLWLRFRTNDLASLCGPPLTLPMVKIQTRKGVVHRAGVERLIELVRRRLGDLRPVFGDDPRPTLERLVLASGGYPRDLLRLVRDAISRSRTFPIEPAQADRAIAILAEEYKLVTLLANLQVAAHIAVHHVLPQGQVEVRDASWLFERWLVLTYRNGDEWYDLHPLVRLVPAVKDAIAAASKAPDTKPAP